MKRIPIVGHVAAVLTGLALIAIVHYWLTEPTTQQPERQPEPAFEYDDADDCNCEIKLPEAEEPVKPVHYYMDKAITHPAWENTALATDAGAAKLFVHDRRFALFQRWAVQFNHARMLCGWQPPGGQPPSDRQLREVR